MTGVSIAPARRAAFEVLRKVGNARGNSDALLHSQQVNQLSPQDRNLCTALVMGTLRWQLVLDAECRKFLTRPNVTLPEDALLALRMGAYQLLFLDRIPRHAAIFESVEWCKHSEGARLSGLVNAVLRKVAASVKKLAFNPELAYPQWMVARWKEFYGEDAARHICEQGQTAPEAALRLLTGDTESILQLRGVVLRPGGFLAKARRVAQVNLKAVNDPQEVAGHALLQDEGSQLVAELVGSGKRILDACSAPGGKTAVLLQNNPDADLLACDLNPARLETMRNRLGATIGLDRVELRVADAARLTGVGEFDRILCDVPCSGTGTLARNPEIRLRLKLEDLARQADRQREILSTCLRLLAPGGRLLYSTCSLEPEENAAVVEACLASAKNEKGRLKKVNLAETFDRLEAVGIVHGDSVKLLRASGFRNGYLRTLPGVHPCDGFFAALIERQ